MLSACLFIIQNVAILIKSNFKKLKFALISETVRDRAKPRHFGITYNVKDESIFENFEKFKQNWKTSKILENFRNLKKNKNLH